MAIPLEDYALIGDGRTAALVSRDGGLDWLCWPRFDSDACFAALLGNEDHGRWSMAPAVEAFHVARRYRGDTLILETDFETAEGAVRLIDFMPVGAPASSVIRLVVGLRGSVAMRSSLRLRFDYGRIMPWVERCEGGFIARVGPDLVVLRAPVPVTASHEQATAEFTVGSGQRLAFVLSYGASNEPAPAAVDADRELTVSDRYWREWIGRFDTATPWPAAVRRSLVTLRALIHLPTGGLIAAPTTSLPESPAGSMNWDYRYCWLRDATFTLSALLNAGYHEEATAWREWILRALAAEPAKLQIMYRVDGARDLRERTIDWLPGYRWSSPVRIGNAAVEQTQIDVYGELLNAMELATRSGIPLSDHGRHVERGIVERLEQIWNLPGQGLWESRGVSRHYTYSRAIAWVGVDRFLKSAERHGHADEAMLDRLRQLRVRIHDEVCREGYDPGLGTFVQHYGGQTLDASLLLLPLVGFLNVEDPRMARTIAAIERDLMRDGLVMREPCGPGRSEGAFLACTCWLADCRRLQGRLAEAEEALERVLAVSTDLGLLSEEYDTRAHRLSGNFPQALSHLAVINTALGFGDRSKRER